MENLAEKQEYINVHIIEKGYDINDFIGYLYSIKGIFFLNN